jgi:SHS2 domain-containing protein
VPHTDFEILEHSADIGFRARGRTIAELFENAAAAMLSIACELTNISPVREYPFEASGSDIESLLVNWLNELLYWTDGKQIAIARVRVKTIDSQHVVAVGMGEPRDPARHRMRIIVKAVTYHQLKVEQAADGWSAEVYLDI